VRELIGAYYQLLRSVIRVRPALRGCLRRCRICRIFFLSHPRNRGRKDLLCPFGCREAHGRRRSTERSVAYYRTPEGIFKKRLHNGKRTHAAAAAAVEEPPSSAPPPAADRPQRAFNPGMVAYLAMAVSLIEGRKVGVGEIVEMLVRVVLRQQGMERLRRVDYVVAQLNENPP